MICPCCGAASRPYSIYCAHCGRLVLNQHEGRARAAALRKAHRKDGFHCQYTDVLLNETDSNLCGTRIFSPAKYCHICSLLVLNSGQGSAAERIGVLIKGRDSSDGSYHCYYSGVKLAHWRRHSMARVSLLAMPRGRRFTVDLDMRRGREGKGMKDPVEWRCCMIAD